MNPGDLAPMKPQVYVDRRPAEYFDRFHYAGMTTGSSVAIVSGDGEWAVSGGSGRVFLWDLRRCPGCGEESHEQHRGLPACTPIRVLAVAEKYRDHLVTSVAVAPDRSSRCGPPNGSSGSSAASAARAGARSAEGQAAS